MVPPPPSWTDQVTPVGWPAVVPVTVALNVREPPVVVEALDGTMLTAMTWASPTTTVAASVRVGSATLVAITWKVPVAPGAT